MEFVKDRRYRVRYIEPHGEAFEEYGVCTGFNFTLDSGCNVLNEEVSLAFPVDVFSVLFLDDLRNPMDFLGNAIREKKAECYHVKDYDNFMQFCPWSSLWDIICFDHDLGDPYKKDGSACVRDMIKKMMEEGNEGPDFFSVHSSNPTGCNRIRGAFRRYKAEELRDPEAYILGT